MNIKELKRILKKGAEFWNQWRKQSNIIPNFHKAKLSKQKLVGYDFSNCIFEDVNLSNADLSKCNLAGAIFKGTNCNEINLTEADLTDTSIIDCNFRNSIFKKSTFNRTIINNVRFESAKFTSTIFLFINCENTNFYKADMYKAFFNESEIKYGYFNHSQLEYSKFIMVNLINCDFSDGHLENSTFFHCNIENNNLFKAELGKSVFRGVNCHNSIFRQANLSSASFTDSLLQESDFFKANLMGTSFIKTNLRNSNIEEASIYGISTWDLQTEGLKQKNLKITKENDAKITVDNIEVAQFIYLLLNNQKIRDVIDTIAKKGVLILGRFTPERKLILDRIKELLRKSGYVPILFDFDKPVERDFTETIKVLAGLSKFVIADITNPKSSPLELQATVPDYQIPFLPIIEKGNSPFSMFIDLQTKYDWMLELFEYKNVEDIESVFQKAIIDRANNKHDSIKNKAKLKKLKSEDFKK